MKQEEIKRDNIGASGEDLAANYLASKGHKLIQRNYRNKLGEIDLVTLKDKNIVFVEVKTRDVSNVEHFLPEYSVNNKKRNKLKRLAELYLSEHKYNINAGVRIDVVGIGIDKKTGDYKINH